MSSRGSVTVFGGSDHKPGTPIWNEGVKLGRLLTSLGYRIITGGYTGAMESVSLGAREEGGNVCGVIVPAVFPDRLTLISTSIM